MKVLKFGGSSLKDAASMMQVGEIIAAEKGDKVIVVSAIQGVTDQLLAFVSSVHKEQDVNLFVRDLKEKHVHFLSEIASTMSVKQDAVLRISEKMVRLERLLYGISYLEELTPRTKDLVQSFGERLSVIIVSAMLQDIGVNAVPVEADELGIITDGTFGTASVDMEGTRKNINPKLIEMMSRKESPVITGFFGKTNEGHITLFGRNGTDYSASVIANAVDAEVLEIWKDVDGFMSADPKVVPGAVPISVLSYEEAAELSYFGARVLHPRTVEPAKERGITIKVKDAFSALDWKAPGDSSTRGPGDQDDQEHFQHEEHGRVPSTYGAGLGYKAGVMSEISVRLSDAGVNIYSAAHVPDMHLCSGGRGRTKEGGERAQGRKEGGHRSNRDREGIALVCIVGEGLGMREGIAAKVFSIVADLNLNVT